MMVQAMKNVDFIDQRKQVIFLFLWWFFSKEIERMFSVFDRNTVHVFYFLINVQNKLISIHASIHAAV